MSPTHLLVCLSCARHVRVTETVCPFCNASLKDAVQAFVPRRRPTERLSRAALYAFGVGSLAVATACGGSTTSGSGANGDSGTHHSGGDSGDKPEDSGPGFGDVQGMALYGGGMPFDAFHADVDEPNDGGTGDADAFMADAAYGGFPVDGSFPPPDAGDGGRETDGAPPADASDAGVAVPYGTPPH